MISRKVIGRVAGLCLLLALPAYADDAPRVELDGGTLCLEPAQRIALAQHLVTADAENAALRQSVAEAPSYRLVLVVAIGAVLAGSAAGYALGRALR